MRATMVAPVTFSARVRPSASSAKTNSPFDSSLRSISSASKAASSVAWSEP